MKLVLQFFVATILYPLLTELHTCPILTVTTHSSDVCTAQITCYDACRHKLIDQCRDILQPLVTTSNVISIFYINMIYTCHQTVGTHVSVCPLKGIWDGSVELGVHEYFLHIFIKHLFKIEVHTINHLPR